jgi:hypothetical protein
METIKKMYYWLETYCSSFAPCLSLCVSFLSIVAQGFFVCLFLLFAVFCFRFVSNCILDFILNATKQQQKVEEKNEGMEECTGTRRL